MSLPASRRLCSALRRTSTFTYFHTSTPTHTLISNSFNLCIKRSFTVHSAYQQAARRAGPSTPPSSSASSRHRSHTPLLAAGSGLLAILFAFLDPVFSVEDDKHDHDSPPRESQAITSDDGILPLYHLSEVKQHGPKSERPWVIYQDKVYDITEWVPAHPGGEVILRSAGGHIEPYWNIFTIHKSPYVREILEQYVVGKLHPDDLGAGQEQIDDPFEYDPARDTSLHMHTQKPCNAETPGQSLADSFLTPNPLFYVRNHMWVPVVDDPEDYDISVELPDGDIKTYTIRDLKARFPLHTVTAVLQCSGNRRKNMTDLAKKTNGLQWTVGAISCAKWEGVRLRDVLADAGVPLDEEPGEDAQHVQFSGMEAYGASIPISSALDPRGDVLLAFRMNDEPLPRDHGYPVRVIVPGHVAARCVKWLKKIVVSDEESNTTWQRRDYKCFGPNEVKQDWDKYKSIQKMPVTSAITRTRLKSRAIAAPDHQASSPTTVPEGNASVSSSSSSFPSPDGVDVVQLEGYAYSGGGHEIQRVDVSLDGGTTWDQAKLLHDDAKLEAGSKSWCWKRWCYEGPLPPAPRDRSAEGGPAERRTTFVVKATDDVYNTQPETQKSIYNLRGNLATAWHRVDFEWKPTGA